MTPRKVSNIGRFSTDILILQEGGLWCLFRRGALSWRNVWPLSFEQERGPEVMLAVLLMLWRRLTCEMRFWRQRRSFWWSEVKMFSFSLGGAGKDEKSDLRIDSASTCRLVKLSWNVKDWGVQEKKCCTLYRIRSAPLASKPLSIAFAITEWPRLSIFSLQDMGYVLSLFSLSISPILTLRRQPFSSVNPSSLV